MRRALIVTTVSGFLPQFEMSNVEILQNKGYEIHYASNFDYPFYGHDNSRLEGTGIICHQVDFQRSPYKMKNIIVFRQIEVLLEKFNFDLIHCHTPMAAVITRLVAKRDKVGTVIYTAHGFHFFKGAPLLNWVLYYPLERLLARRTDMIITINHEDYQAAQKFKCRFVEYVPGVGVDIEIKIKKPLDRKYMGFENKILLLSVGELSKRKNHEVIIRALGRLKNPDLVYLICGQGASLDYLKKLAVENGVENQVLFWGYIEDIYAVYAITDIFLLPSLQEGLSRALLEAMAAGLPIIASSIRGNNDLIVHQKNGLLVDIADVKAYAEAIDYLIHHPEVMDSMKEQNLKMIKKYDRKLINSKMRCLYDKAEDVSKI